MAIQGLCAPALFHKEQRDHLQEGWFPQGKPNCGPSSISWATGSGATYLTSLAFSHLENNNNSNNMSWAVIRILSFCFPDTPSFFSPRGLCTCCFLGRGLSHQTCVASFFSSFRPQSKHPLLKEVFSDHPIKNGHPWTLLSHCFILLFT